jgi:plastocyanin
MIEIITRSSSRTLLPILSTIVGLATVGVAGIGIRGVTAPETPVSHAPSWVADTMMVAAPMPVPAAEATVVRVYHRTQHGGASGVFSPSRVVVRRGDVVRIETDGLAAHNVSFLAVDNQGAAFLPPSTPYLTSPGQSHDLPIDLEPGVYRFQCDPHAAMGEYGVLEVREGADAPGPVRRETR